MKNLNIAWKQEKNLDDDDAWLCAACPVLDRGAGPGTGQNHNPRPFLAPAKIHNSTGAPDTARLIILPPARQKTMHLLGTQQGI